MNLELDNIKVQNERIQYKQIYEVNGKQIIEDNDLIEIIANILTEIIQQYDKLPIEFISNFHGKSIPNISIKDYLLRIHKCSNCAQESFILALIYIDRLTERHKNFLLNSYNIHRVLITSIMLSIKFYDDRYYNNEYYGKVGGISIQEINQLERDFLQLINFRLHIHPSIFYKYREKLLESQQISE
ncbi:hypothetical protein IMG5_180520 [Ichthyophthirius multifiliis]|uniref:Cyclin n=1 Tax=Ichthyophthirius multifiliis TaxID=5932 RepID=G0R2Q8_ICHMU|nr:hypothetical protein IMG5_180520 [Ichthyophthirius multifiliis]EGR28252.1 hypothetical protein IMG5_180520 [Ichthyophthirius multifiliis]|eukprot:XP_004027597.1 hypothetical protein IMG5_180520 [Ichthyophthirius multifiliis]